MKNSKKFISVAKALVLAMVLNILTAFSSIAVVSAAPSVTPPSSRPRVLFTSSDISAINAYLDRSDAESQKLRTWFRAGVCLKEDAPNGGGDVSDSGAGWNMRMLGYISAKALAYALGRDIDNPPSGSSYEARTANEAGELAADWILEYVNTMDLSKDTGNKARDAGLIMYTVALVYDWCYDKFSTAERTTLRNKVGTLRSYLEMGSNFSSQNGLVGHGSEAQLLRDGLACAIAFYGDDNSLWNSYAGNRFYSEYVPIRDHFLPSSYALQGNNYGIYRNRWDTWAYLLITGMGAASPYSASATEGLKKSAYQIVYGRRPDGQMFRDGDMPAEYTNLFSVWNDYYDVAMMDAAIANDPYLKSEYLETRNDSPYDYNGTLPIIIFGKNGDTEGSKSIKNLPTTRYFGSPAGIMFARTNWNIGPKSNAAAAFLKIGEEFTSNHQHLNSGDFQLYYKGSLATASGIYQGQNDSNSGTGATGYESDHRYYYAIQTVAHNGVIIKNMNQRATGTSKSGLMTSEFDGLSDVKTMGQVQSYSVDQTNPIRPNYSYIKGNIKDAYTSTAGVSAYKRYFMFLDLKRDDVPAALIVYDYISAGSNKKQWIMHSQGAPAITTVGNYKRTVVTNTTSDATGSYNGKLTVDTLLPQNAEIESLGQQGGWSKATNYNYYEGYESGNITDEGNAYRIDITSTGSQFLNVLQVSDANKSNYLDVTRIGGDYVVGAVIADRVVTFHKSGDTFTSTFSFSAPSGTKEYTVCDVKRGAWKVSTDSSFSTYDVVGTSNSDDDNVLHFTKTLASSGTLYLTPYASGGGFSGSGLSPADRTLGTPTSYDYCDLYNDSELYITSNYAMFESGTGYPLVAAKDFADIVDAEMSVVGNTVTLTKDDDTASFTVGSATITKNGGEAEAKASEATPVLINGEIYISPKTVAPFFLARCTVGDDYVKLIPNAFSGSLAVEYSADGVNFTPISIVGGTTEYNVTLPTNAKYGYLRVTVPIGCDAIDSMRYSYKMNNPKDYFSGGDDVLVGTSGSIATTSFRQLQVPVPALKVDSYDYTRVYKVPIKNECSWGMFKYTDEEETVTSYTVNLHARQPRLTTFTDNMGQSQGVLFIGGAAVNNDNGTVLQTSITGSSTGKKNSLKVLANISNKLLGASAFILPTISSANSTSENMFQFTADHGGTVYMMVDDPLSGTNYDSWTCLNNGVNPSNLSDWRTSNTRFIKPRTYNSYGLDYWATSLQWYYGGATNDPDDTYNAYRTTSPGVDGSTNSENIRNSYNLYRTYSKHFDYGETVVIPGWGNTSGDSLILVQWDDGSETGVDPTPAPSDEMLIYYSSTGSKYTAIPDTTDSTTNYRMVLPDNTQYAYVRFAVPSGCSAPSTVRYSWDVGNSKNFFNGNTSKLVGTAGYNNYKSFATQSFRQNQVPMKVLKENGAFKVPIKNEHSYITFSYTDENDTERDYRIDFHAKQPRLTSFTSNVNTSSSGVVYIGGAAVNNDNGSILRTGMTGSSTSKQGGAWGTSLKVMSYVTDPLLGASMFVLPDLTSSNCADANLFQFTADHGGTLYMMVDDPIGDTTATTNYDSWTELNNGTEVNYDLIRSSKTRYTANTTFNDFEETDYFAMALQWYHNGADNTISPTYNAYRATSPGTTAVINSTHIWNSTPLYRVYSKTFSKGETVTVPGFGNTSGDSVFLIQWTDADIPDDSVAYCVSRAGKTTVKTEGFGNANKIISALYDGDELINVLFDSVADGIHEFDMGSSKMSEADKVGIFIWDVGQLKTYFKAVFDKEDILPEEEE